MERQVYPSILFGRPIIFPTRDESLYKMGGMVVPEIFDVFSFHATHFPPRVRKQSCAPTSGTFPRDAEPFLSNWSTPIIVRKTLLNVLTTNILYL